MMKPLVDLRKAGDSGLLVHGRSGLADWVGTVGQIQQSLPTLTWTSLALAQQMQPGALGIALMSFTETIAAGRAFAAKS